jgi:rSAM/selenodomain-associated transferase 1
VIVAVAVLAKAPLAGFAKTRLIPALGADGAAALQARLIARAVTTACAAGIGPVTLWATPDETHPVLQAIAGECAVALVRQREGDLGARMLAALAAANASALVIGTDCPALTSGHLRTAADILRGGADAVVLPAEDGGYVLIGMRAPEPALFSGMRWSTPDVMDETRRRPNGRHELARAGHVGRGLPADLERLRRIGPHDLIPARGTSRGRRRGAHGSGQPDNTSRQRSATP